MTGLVGSPLASLPFSSSARSTLSASFLLTKEKILPQRSATNRRLVPGAKVRSSGSSNLGSFGNAGSVVYGGGGSGEPITRDVVHGTRLSMPYSLRTDLVGPSAARVFQDNEIPRATTGRSTTSRRMGESFARNGKMGAPIIANSGGRARTFARDVGMALHQDCDQ